MMDVIDTDHGAVVVQYMSLSFIASRFHQHTQAMFASRIFATVQLIIAMEVVPGH